MPKKVVNPVDEAVGVRIRLLRTRRKMSQSELGKALDVTFQQIQKYESGKNRVSASRLQMVANALNVRLLNYSAVQRLPVATRQGRRSQSRLTRSRFASPKPSSKSPTRKCAPCWSMWRKLWRGSPTLASSAHAQTPAFQLNQSVPRPLYAPKCSGGEMVAWRFSKC
jgi:transcriptional regulator with XRE-family HTH domain